MTGTAMVMTAITMLAQLAAMVATRSRITGVREPQRIPLMWCSRAPLVRRPDHAPPPPITGAAGVRLAEQRR